MGKLGNLFEFGLIGLLNAVKDNTVTINNNSINRMEENFFKKIVTYYLGNKIPKTFT